MKYGIQRRVWCPVYPAVTSLGVPILIIIIIIIIIIIAVPNTHKLAKTITDKQNKYQDLANEICAMWKQNAVQVISIVIPSTGGIPKSLSQSIKRLNLHPNT
jgi:predicted PurR-regulated permease PerM